MVFHAAKEPGPMSAAAAMVLSCALEMGESELTGRRKRAAELLTRLNGTRSMLPVRPIVGGESGFLRAAFIDTVGDRLPAKTLGAVRGYPLTLEQHPELKSILIAGERAGKGAILLRDRLFTLPTHSRVRDADLSRLAEWLTAAPSVSSPATASALAT
jgi:hypothetical protein